MTSITMSNMKPTVVKPNGGGGGDVTSANSSPPSHNLSRNESSNSLWDFEDDSDYEFTDNDVRRIIIVTQGGSVPVFKGDRARHEGYDRQV